MSESDFLDDRRRASEDDYFHRKDRELIEKMRKAAEADRTASELREKTGLADPELVTELQALGFTPDTLSVLPLVPIVQMAWAEGGITAPERVLLVKLARERGIVEGSAADKFLTEWMARKPSEDDFARATRLIRAMLDSGSPQTETMSVEDLVRYAESIASASGGIFGLGAISSDERATLAKIVAELKGRDK